MDKVEIWKLALEELEVVLSRANFTTWFKDTFILSYKNEVVVVGVPSNFAKEWLENKYKIQIKDALKKSLPRLKRVEFKVTSQKEDLGENLTKKEIPEPTPVVKSNRQKDVLNSKNVFVNFVVGESNKLAHAAALAVAKKPGRTYNPLFIYGDVGLGKTHLIQAIGNEAMRRFPNKKTIYVSCEQFASEFITAVKAGKMEKFKEKYRHVDLLIIDDAHFLTGKEGTQEEFFHTFNALHQKSKQIVISCDRPPKSIPLLGDRLQSRFEWGMIADIGVPDFETRCAIIQAKAKEKKFNIPKEIVEALAENIQHNVRELEGSLNRLVAYCELNDQKPTLKLVDKVIESFKVRTKTDLKPDKILKTVYRFYEVNEKDFFSQKRNKEISVPRQIAMYLLRSELNFSFPKIANVLEKKDHTTIMHGCSKIEKVLQSDESMRKEIALLKEKLYG